MNLVNNVRPINYTHIQNVILLTISKSTSITNKRYYTKNANRRTVYSFQILENVNDFQMIFKKRGIVL